MDVHADGSADVPHQDRRIEQLTIREPEVLFHIATGRSNQQLADQLFNSDDTAKTHIERILGKLNGRDRAQAVVIAYETGLMDP